MQWLLISKHSFPISKQYIENINIYICYISFEYYLK